MNNIVVTGATSMLGVATIKQILDNEKEAEIFAVVRKNSRNTSRLPWVNRVHIIECDIGQYHELKELIKAQCDVFYHFAWKATNQDRDSNVEAQGKNVSYCLDAVRAAYDLRCKKFIGSGSQAEYGLLELDRISPETPINPLTPYGVAKYAAGKLSRMLSEQLNMDCLWVRVFSVYGPNDKKTTLISSAIDGLMNNKRVSFTPAEQRWDYLYSSDAGNAFYMIGKNSTGRKVYCLGSGQARLLKDYIYNMQQVINPNCPVGIGDNPYPKNCVMNICADIRSLQADTGWKPEVSFEEGIKMIIQNRLTNRGGEGLALE